MPGTRGVVPSPDLFHVHQSETLHKSFIQEVIQIYYILLTEIRGTFSEEQQKVLTKTESNELSG